MENKATDLWTSYKELNQFVEGCITKPVDGVAVAFSKTLSKYKHNFLHVMKNAPKNSRSLKVVESKASSNGSTLPQEIVDEAITLSNIYNLDEQVALDLLLFAQQRCADYPGIPRGPVAILLYYDAHLALVNTLKMLVQAHQGLRWETNCASNVQLQKTINKFVDDLISDGLLESILGVLSSMNVMKEIAVLQQNRGLGGAYHHHMVNTIYSGIQASLADIVLLYSCQCGLSSQQLVALLNHLRTTTPEHDARGGMDSVTLTLLMALLYGIDMTIVQEKDDFENIQSLLPLLSEDNLIRRFNTELCNSQSTWSCEGVRTIIQFAWGLTLASVRSFTSNVRSINNLPDDEDTLVNQCIESNVFHLLNHSVLSVDVVFKQELFLRKLHSLITEFIVLMPIHVRELRAKADKECLKIQAHLKEGLHPPSDVSKHFEEFLQTISLLYSKDPGSLNLHQEYWCLQNPNSLFKTRIPPKQICLLKFIKQSGESLPSQLFVPYLKMITALTASSEAARETFSMLKNFQQFFCWDHFFTSLSFHLTQLRQDHNPTTDTIYHRHHHKGIPPLEVQGLQAVLGLIRTVASHDVLSRQKFCEHTAWNAVQVMLSLLSCSVNIELKAELVLTLASFAKSPSVAAALWHQIEASQIIPTVQSTSYFKSRGVLSELEEVESRNAEYPLTLAILSLLSELTNSSVPYTLGSGTRTPGLDPYIEYILKSVFLNFANRSYKDPSEKWEVARSCVELFVKFTFDYEPRHEDFVGEDMANRERGGVKVNPHPGFHIMLNMCSQSQLLRKIFFIIDEACLQLDTYSPFPGKAALEAASLECLRLISCVLDLQKTFLSFDSQYHTSYLLVGLHKLLFGMNIRSNQPDHAVNVAKFLTYNSWLPHHAYYSAKILRLLTSYATAQNELRSSIISSTSLRQTILHGFVKCLEADDLTDSEPPVANKAKVFILKMMLQCLNYSTPNLTHFLCGFNVSNVSKSVLQHAGVLGSPRTCLHSVISLLGDDVMHIILSNRCPKDTSFSLVIKLCYQLLYVLGAHTTTSAATLRYLSSNDVLYLHLTSLPFLTCDTPSTEDYYQMSWLLNLVAIELSVTARQSQMSQLSRLVHVLTGAGAHQESTRYSILNSLSPPSGAHLILRLLSLFDLSLETIEKPTWENFEDDKIMEILAEAEFVAEPHLKKINVKRVRRILMNELAMVTEWPTLTRKQQVLAEIDEVVDFAIRLNKQKQSSHAVWSYFQAWKHVAGTLFEVTPHEMIPFQSRFELLVQLIEALLRKVEVDTIRTDLACICSESLLHMMSNLRASFTRERQSKENLVLSQLMSPEELTILPSLVNWILNSGTTSQQIRVNFNASLLTFLHMARDDGLALKQLALGSQVKEDLSYREDLDTIAVTSPFNKLIDELPADLIQTLCIDCTGGQDMNKMIAMAALNSIIEVNPKWISQLNHAGFFSVLIDSLLLSDASLIDVLLNKQENLRPLFVFEAKMDLLTRVALSRQGAQILLEHNVMQCLCDMKVFDKHPDISYFSTTDQEETPASNVRFKQIMAPTLTFMKSILIALGYEDRCATTQLMQFLLKHMESLMIVLRYGGPQLRQSLSQELAGVTSILSAAYNETEGNVSPEFLRLQSLMTAQLRQSLSQELASVTSILSAAYNETEGNVSPEFLRLQSLMTAQLRQSLSQGLASVTSILSAAYNETEGNVSPKFLRLQSLMTALEQSTVLGVTTEPSASRT